MISESKFPMFCFVLLLDVVVVVVVVELERATIEGETINKESKYQLLELSPFQSPSSSSLFVPL